MTETITFKAAQDVYRACESVIDKVQDGLPGPFGFAPDWTLGRVKVSWMLQDDLEGSRAVMNAYPGTWTLARSGSGREPVWDYEDERLDITLWAHPDTIQMTVQIPEGES